LQAGWLVGRRLHDWSLRSSHSGKTDRPGSCDSLIGLQGPCTNMLPTSAILGHDTHATGLAIGRICSSETPFLYGRYASLGCALAKWATYSDENMQLLNPELCRVIPFVNPSSSCSYYALSKVNQASASVTGDHHLRDCTPPSAGLRNRLLSATTCDSCRYSPALTSVS